MSSSKRQMHALTGIRFFLAFWVVIYHRLSKDPLWLQDIDGLQPVWAILHSGYAAVGMFFVLSGFVLAYNYPLGHFWSAAEVKRFAVARFSRIYPAYFLGLVLMVPFFLYRFVNGKANVLLDSVTAAMNFSLVQAWLPQTALTWNDPGWSLSNEAFFYACFPLVGVLVWKASSVRSYVLWTLALWALSVAGPLWAVWRPVHGFGDVEATTAMTQEASLWTNIIRYNPLIRLPEFCMGILVGRIFASETGLRQRLEGRGQWLYLPAGLVTVVVLGMAARIPYPFLHNGLLLPLYSVIVLGLAYSGGWVARVLSLPLFVFLGNASYSMYILHVPISSWLESVTKRIPHAPGELDPLWLAIYLLLVLVASSLVFRYFEEPLHYRLKSYLGGRRR